jgi:hypothetical protein
MAHAILTHGWENFTHEILFEHLTEKEAKQKEKELIDLYDSYEHGLNCTRGGNGVTRYRSAEEARAAALDLQRRRMAEIYASTEKHEKLKEAQKISHTRRKLDPVKHAKDLESCKQANRRRRADPAIKQQVNESARKSYAKKRSTEEGLAEIREYTREYRKEQMKDPEKRKLANERAIKARQKVTDCRKLLKEIYKNNTTAFTKEDVHNIFDKKPGSKNYQCMTFSILNEILERVQEGLVA